MTNEINIALEREDAIKIGKFISKNVGQMVDVVPAVKLIEALSQAGIGIEELQ